jgi:hypothetical protein
MDPDIAAFNLACEDYDWDPMNALQSAIDGDEDLPPALASIARPLLGDHPTDSTIEDILEEIYSIHS